MNKGDLIKIKEDAWWHIFYWWSNNQKKPLYVIDKDINLEGGTDLELLYISTDPNNVKENCETIFDEDVEKY